MRANTKREIWITLAREQYPMLTETELDALSMRAASQWYLGEENELTKLFDQYVMLKTIQGIPNTIDPNIKGFYI
jgi:hypothetical protein